ncbi:MAG: Vps62-related protein [Candidatus Bathyarchaeota archaeon]|jgi:hypothetical protein
MIRYLNKPAVASIIFLLIALLIFSQISMVKSQDSDNDGVEDSKEDQLANLYAPYLYFTAEETLFPTSISYHIENSVLYQKSDDTNTLIDPAPTIDSISTFHEEDYFLNNTLGGFNEILEDYGARREAIGDIVYSRVTQSGTYYVIQYWFFYAFNPGTLNQHQGDWEMIEIILNSVEAPQYAVYSQHFQGERATWNDVEKVDGTHPRVYVAQGSHANYFRPYQGKLGLESDIVGNALTLEPNDFQIILLGESGIGEHPASQDWLEYGGRWGDWPRLIDLALGGAGPSGPGHNENEEKWINPVSWGLEAFPVDQMWFSLSWITYYFLYIFAGIVAIIVIVKVWQIVKRKEQEKLNLLKILRTKGGIGVILGIIALTVYLLALLVPWYLVTGNIQTTELDTAGVTDLVVIDGVNGLRVNTLQSDRGLTQLIGIGIPFSIILVAGVIMNIFNIAGVEKPTRLSRSFIISGVTALIPVIIIILFITQLASLIGIFASSIGGGATPPQIQEMADRMASTPIMGEYSGPLDSVGNISITWGLAFGSYLFITAAILRFAAGIVARTARIEPKTTQEEPKTKEPEPGKTEPEKKSA